MYPHIRRGKGNFFGSRALKLGLSLQPRAPDRTGSPRMKAVTCGYHARTTTKTTMTTTENRLPMSHLKPLKPSFGQNAINLKPTQRRFNRSDQGTQRERCPAPWAWLTKVSRALVRPKPRLKAQQFLRHRQVRESCTCLSFYELQDQHMHADVCTAGASTETKSCMRAGATCVHKRTNMLRYTTCHVTL